jgi:PhoPQ-activated pathogenicity-related protein
MPWMEELYRIAHALSTPLWLRWGWRLAFRLSYSEILMRRSSGIVLALALCLAYAVAAVPPQPAPKAGAQTVLDRYVHRPGPAFRWTVARTLPGEGYTAYVVEMTSQSWRKPAEVDRPVWNHLLTIVRPDKVTTSTGFLMIGGGSIDDKLPVHADATLVDIAVSSGSVVAELRNVPSQPLKFPDEPKGLIEDGIITYTWDKFLRGGDDDWPLQLPMTKAAVRAMDTMTAFCASEQGGHATVDRFFVAGASKRGWTTWTTAAVDKRVIGIAPIVIDLLNMVPSFEHHYQVYGGWAPAVKDYVERGIMDWSGSKRYDELMTIVEPFSYRDRLTMPKFMINAAGDQFFIPDSSQFYFDELQGEKYLRYVPNAGHGLQDSDARQSLIAFYDAFLHGRPRPKFGWKYAEDGTLRVTTGSKPTAVKLWQATNPAARDFRLDKIGPAYRATELEDTGQGVYVAKVPVPAKGWTAYFVELTYPSGGKYDFKFTTPVKVTPDRLPHPPFVPKVKH